MLFECWNYVSKKKKKKKVRNHQHILAILFRLRRDTEINEVKNILCPVSLHNQFVVLLLWHPFNWLTFLGLKAEMPHYIHECLQLFDRRDNLKINMSLRCIGNKFLLLCLEKGPSVRCATLRGRIWWDARPINKHGDRSQKKLSVFGTSEASKRAVIMLSTGFWLVFARTYYCVIHLSLHML